MNVKEGHLARHYLQMDITVLAVKRVERQVKLAGVHRTVLPAHRQWVFLPRVDVHCGRKTGGLVSYISTSTIINFLSLG